MTDNESSVDQIAREGLLNARRIEDVAASMGMVTTPRSLHPCGAYVAKVDPNGAVASPRRGRLVLVTAMTPDPRGSGKTLTTIALADALNLLHKTHVDGRRATAVLRQPSLGPVFGAKGGATGGGRAQLVPMQDINLHLTGDAHAVSAAHALLHALVMAYAYEGRNCHDVDLTRIQWPIAVDMVDRSMRDIQLSTAGRLRDPSEQVHTRAIITAASEVMATFGIADDIDDLGQRLARIVVAWMKDGSALRAGTLEAQGPMQALLLRAMMPNLVQTLDGNGVLVHAGPFGNIAHGCPSVSAMRLAMEACDEVVVEAGFGADMGAQKFLDLVCRPRGWRPSVAAVVCGTRDLARQGGVEGKASDWAAVNAGLWNLRIHVENLKARGLPVVVLINRFASDENALLERLRSAVIEELGVPCAWHEGHDRGAEGALEAARLVAGHCTAEPPPIERLYDTAMPAAEKARRIGSAVYRAGEVQFGAGVVEQMEAMEKLEGRPLEVCMSKTPYSLGDDANVRGDPTGRPLRVTGARLSAGPGWIIVLCGNVLEMPGLDFAKCGARRMRLVRDEQMFGGYRVVF